MNASDLPAADGRSSGELPRRNRATAGLLLAVAGTLLSGCSSTEVMVDYDSRADFSGLRTWSWASGSSLEKVAAHPHPLAFERAKAAVESVLAAKGYSQAPPDRADFLVDASVLVERRTDVDPGYYGWGGGWGWGGYGFAGPYWGGGWTSHVYTTDYCIVAVNILQARPTSRVLWRGVAESPRGRGLTPQEREAKIRREVDEILASFPPGRPPS